MSLAVYPNRIALAQAVAREAQALLIKTIEKNGTARIVAATGASQLDTLEELIKLSGIAWDKVEMFHLDEYVGLGEDHPASFARYLRERLIDKTGIRKFHLIDGTRPTQETIATLNHQIAQAPIDLTFAGIGENGHLAFNDPPADFATEQPYLVVSLDEMCRRQQFGEGWFTSIEEVPTQAISMSVQQILKSSHILVAVPDARKSRAVQQCLEEEISPLFPASILRTHPNATVFLDEGSASLLSSETLKQGLCLG